MIWATGSAHRAVAPLAVPHTAAAYLHVVNYMQYSLCDDKKNVKTNSNMCNFTIVNRTKDKVQKRGAFVNGTDISKKNIMEA